MPIGTSSNSETTATVAATTHQRPGSGAGSSFQAQAAKTAPAVTVAVMQSPRIKLAIVPALTSTPSTSRCQDLPVLRRRSRCSGGLQTTPVLSSCHSLRIRHDGELIEVDSRPSDAIALVVTARVPIYVAEEVLDEVCGE